MPPVPQTVSLGNLDQSGIFEAPGAAVTTMRLLPGKPTDSTGSDKVRLSIQTQIEHIFASGQISRREHLALTSALLAGQLIDDRDRCHINQIIECVQLGKLQLID